MSGEWTTIDKNTWGDGPWQDEPDKIHWIDPATDLDCLMVRTPGGGHWCGYVAVTEGHPFYERGYDECGLDVHGGLTFSDFCAESDDPSQFICHVPEPGRPDKVWWLGFDCAHLGDSQPAYVARYSESFGGPFETYKERSYVEAEIRSLALQIKAVPV